MVDLAGGDGPDEVDQRHRIGQVAIVELKARARLVWILVDVIEPAGVERRGPPDDAVDLVALTQQQLGQIATVLPPDACDQCSLQAAPRLFRDIPESIKNDEQLGILLLWTAKRQRPDSGRWMTSSRRVSFWTDINSDRIDGLVGNAVFKRNALYESWTVPFTCHIRWARVFLAALPCRLSARQLQTRPAAAWRFVIGARQTKVARQLRRGRGAVRCSWSGHTSGRGGGRSRPCGG